jgi:hypothetical protein
MKTALAVLFVWPVLGLRAEPIVVEYEGTISEVIDTPGYAVGDRISGRLSIDPALAFPDSDPRPEAADYRSNSPAFVSGFMPSFGLGFDEVGIGKNVVGIQGIDGPIDFFSVTDWFVSESGSQDAGRMFSLEARARGFLDDTRLDQSFELTTADIDESVEDLSGSFDFNILGESLVRFVVSRLTVKPGRCFAP